MIDSVEIEALKAEKRGESEYANILKDRGVIEPNIVAVPKQYVMLYGRLPKIDKKAKF
jgi:hypothetical protein